VTPGPNACFTENGNTLAGSSFSHTVCNAFILDNYSEEMCHAGDSGGPVLERQSDGYILAAGIIDAGDNSSNPNFCYGTAIAHIRSTASVVLLWGP